MIMLYIRIKRLSKITIVCALVFLMAVLGCNLIIEYSSQPYLYNQTQSLPNKKIGLILGTSPYFSNGTKNLYFQYRVEAAAQLYKEGKIQYILASGDNHHVNYNEPQKIKQALIKLGVPKESIYLDFAGFSTYESIVRCKKVFQEEDIIIISQEFHNQRALYIANKMDMKAVAFNAKDPEFSDYVKFREYFARVKAMIDVHMLKKNPRFLGHPIMIGGLQQ